MNSTYFGLMAEFGEATIPLTRVAPKSLKEWAIALACSEVSRSCFYESARPQMHQNQIDHLNDSAQRRHQYLEARSASRQTPRLLSA